MSDIDLYDLNNLGLETREPGFDRETAMLAQDDTDHMNAFPKMGKSMAIAELLLKKHNKQKIADFMGVPLSDIEEIEKSWYVQWGMLDGIVEKERFIKCITEHQRSILEQVVKLIGYKRLNYVHTGAGTAELTEPYFITFKDKTDAMDIFTHTALLLYCVLKLDIYECAENMNLPVSMTYILLANLFNTHGITMDMMNYLIKHKNAYDSLSLIRNGPVVYLECLRSLYVSRRAQEIMQETSGTSATDITRVEICSIIFAKHEATFWDKIRVFFIPKITLVKGKLRFIARLFDRKKPNAFRK